MQYILPLNSHAFLSSADFACFFCRLMILNLSRIPLESQIVWVQFRLDIWPDLGPNCLQRSLADDTSEQRGVD